MRWIARLKPKLEDPLTFLNDYYDEQSVSLSAMPMQMFTKFCG